MSKVITGKVRFSYCFVSSPKIELDDNGKEYKKWQTAVLIPKSDKETLTKIKNAVEEAKREGVSSKWGGKVPPNIKTPLRDGDVDRPDDQVYKGHYFLTASCTSQAPGLVDKDRQPILDGSQVYSGCYGRVSLTFYPFDRKGNRGIACGLNNIQKLCDGEPLGGRSRAEDDFEAVPDTDDDFLV